MAAIIDTVANTGAIVKAGVSLYNRFRGATPSEHLREGRSLLSDGMTKLSDSSIKAEHIDAQEYKKLNAGHKGLQIWGDTLEQDIEKRKRENSKKGFIRRVKAKVIPDIDLKQAGSGFKEGCMAWNDKAVKTSTLAKGQLIDSMVAARESQIEEENDSVDISTTAPEPLNQVTALADFTESRVSILPPYDSDITDCTTTGQAAKS